MSVKKRKIKIFVYILSAIAIVLIAVSFISKSNLRIKHQITDKNIVENDLDIVYGSDSARITVFMYSSYNCHFCTKFLNETYPQLKDEYIDSGKVRFVIKLVEFSKDEYLINSIKTAVCINKFGDFEMLNKLLLTDPSVVYTKEFNEVIDEFIEKDSFVAECMLSGEADSYILSNVLEFKDLKLTGTPSFIVKKKQTQGKPIKYEMNRFFYNRFKHRGVKPTGGDKIFKGYKDYNTFKNVIEKELSNNLN